MNVRVVGVSAGFVSSIQVGHEGLATCKGCERQWSPIRSRYVGIYVLESEHMFVLVNKVDDGNLCLNNIPRERCCREDFCQYYAALDTE